MTTPRLGANVCVDACKRGLSVCVVCVVCVDDGAPLPLAMHYDADGDESRLPGPPVLVFRRWWVGGWLHVITASTAYTAGHHILVHVNVHNHNHA